MPVIENNKEMVPFEYYLEKYTKLDTAEAAARTGVKYDLEKNCFCMRLLYQDYRLYWPEFRIECDNENALALKSIPAQIYLIRFLMEGCASTGGGSFLTYREMPWGDVYLTPFTGRCLTRAAFTFGTRLNAFNGDSAAVFAAAYKIQQVAGAWLYLAIGYGLFFGFRLIRAELQCLGLRINKS